MVKTEVYEPIPFFLRHSTLGGFPVKMLAGTTRGLIRWTRTA
jgi:hypothetical protein